MGFLNTTELEAPTGRLRCPLQRPYPYCADKHHRSSRIEKEQAYQPHQPSLCASTDVLASTGAAARLGRGRSLVRVHPGWSGDRERRRGSNVDWRRPHEHEPAPGQAFRPGRPPSESGLFSRSFG